jgi:hypothetical protein
MHPCNKRTYSREAAIRALARIKERKETGTFTDPCSANRAYYCEHHKAWHLTKKPLTRRPRADDVLPQGEEQ